MKTNMLDTLYGLLQEQLDYDLDEPEIKQSREKLMELTKKAGMDYEDIEYFVLDYGIAYEKAGFRNGFVLATRIFAECMTTCRTTERIAEDMPEDPPDA